MVHRRAPIAFALASAALLVGCAAKRPVLYPDASLERAGPEVARLDVDDCLAFASESGYGANRGGRVAGSAATGAAVGGAAGAATGAVFGRPGKGAAAGAAGAGAAGFMRGLLRWREPDPIERRFVEICLRERGYRTIGWR